MYKRSTFTAGLSNKNDIWTPICGKKVVIMPCIRKRHAYQLSAHVWVLSKSNCSLSGKVLSYRRTAVHVGRDLMTVTRILNWCDYDNYTECYTGSQYPPLPHQWKLRRKIFYQHGLKKGIDMLRSHPIVENTYCQLAFSIVILVHHMEWLQKCHCMHFSYYFLFALRANLTATISFPRC